MTADRGMKQIFPVRKIPVQKKFGKKLPMETFFQHPTIEGMANALRSETGDVQWTSLAAIQPKG